jgi:hypothetical protein
MIFKNLVETFVRLVTRNSQANLTSGISRPPNFGAKEMKPSNQNSYERLLTDAQVSAFRRDGFIKLDKFYDLESEVFPVQEGIRQIIGMMVEKYLPGKRMEEGGDRQFDDGFLDLVSHDRALGGRVYDAVKHLPAFVRLCASKKHDSLMMQLRETDLPGLPSGGSGIRIDIPFEDLFRANWHQDYPSQFRSMDGLVFWSPLVPITKEIGPLQIAVGSHREGIAPLLRNDPENAEKSGAYALRLRDEEELLGRYQKIEGYSEPGDLLLIDYLNLHASGHNRSDRARWSMQMRYFNYREPIGRGYDWVGSFAAGVDIGKIHPELISSEP